jgi:phthalate 4,5-dioxygenase
MGPFVDHDNATFVASDLLVARMRRRMLAAAEALAQGKPPPGIEEPACYRDVWSGYFIAPRETDLARGLRQEHPARERSRGLNSPAPMRHVR